MSTRAHSTTLLTIGDPVPDRPLASQLGPKVSVHGPAFAGNPIVLFTCRHLEAPAMAALEAVGRSQDRFSALGARILAVTGESIATNAAAAEKAACRFPVLSDTLDRLLSMLDDASGHSPASLLVVDRGLRLVERFGWEGASTVEAALALCARMRDEERGPAPVVVQQAPVLLVPSVFPAAFCARLVDRWASAPEKEEDLAGSHRESGDPEVDVVSRRRPSVKRRTDWFVEEGPVHAEIRELLRRRVGPELRKAFDFTPGRCEQLRVGCYDAERGGCFRRHRDNVLGRRFSMSINLNEDYEGGELCFPEYGRQLYRPPAGGALIFAAPLLHEVMEVRRGRRFVLVTFFCGKELPP